MSGLEAYNDAGYLQFSSDKTWQIRLVQKGVVNLTQPVSYSSQSAVVVNTPAGLKAPIVALRCISPVAPYQSHIASDGSGTFYFNSNGAQGGTCAYYIFEAAPTVMQSSGAGLEVYRADGTLCFSSNYGFFNVAAVMSSYDARISLPGGRLYASFVPTFSGYLHQSAQSDEARSTRYVQTTGSMGAFVNLPGATAGITSVGWADSNSAPAHAEVNMAAVPIFILDVTSFGTISGEITYQAVLSPASASATQTQTSSYSFPAETVTISGSASNVSYSWSIQGASGGSWSVSSGQGTASAVASVSGVQDASKATATLQCVVTANGSSQTVNASLAYYSAANPNAVAVGMSPGDQSATTNSSVNPTFNFSQQSISVKNGNASSYNWTISNVAGGNWSVSSGQGSANATITVSGVSAGNSGSATVTCATVVNGATYKNSANYTFTNNYQGGGGGNQN